MYLMGIVYRLSHNSGVHQAIVTGYCSFAMWWGRFNAKMFMFLLQIVTFFF